MSLLGLGQHNSVGINFFLNKQPKQKRAISKYNNIKNLNFI